MRAGRRRPYTHGLRSLFAGSFVWVSWSAGGRRARSASEATEPASGIGVGRVTTPARLRALRCDVPGPLGNPCAYVRRRPSRTPQPVPITEPIGACRPSVGSEEEPQGSTNRERWCWRSFHTGEHVFDCEQVARTCRLRARGGHMRMGAESGPGYKTAQGTKPPSRHKHRSRSTTPHAAQTRSLRGGSPIPCHSNQTSGPAKSEQRPCACDLRAPTPRKSVPIC